MKKYLQIPSIREWQMYYEYNDSNLTHQQIGEKYCITREKARQLITKVQRYLRNGNTRILTKEQILK